MKRKLGTLTGLFVLVLLAAVSPAWSDQVNQADQAADEAAINQAVLNYVNAIYLVKPKLIDKSVSPKLQKVGYAPKSDGTGYREMWMTFDDLKALAANYNTGGEIDPETARRDIVILGQLDQVAIVRLEAAWGIDFIQLAREGGKWMIMNVIWQTYPGQ